MDLITDFENGVDIIDLSLWAAVTAFGDLTVQDGTLGAEVFKTGAPAHMIILEGIAASTADQFDFDFV